MQTAGTVRGSAIIVLGIISVLLGLGVGLVIAWVVAPVQYINADPVDLRTVYKQDYLRLISAAYQADGNLQAARTHIQLLGITDLAQTFDNLIRQANSNERQFAMTVALARLAHDLGLKIQSAAAFLTPTPEAPLVTASATPIPVTYRVAEKITLTCADEPEDAYLRLIVRDARGRDVPNTPIEIRWETGEETLYTGLKPEQGLGYADFIAAPGKYSAKIQNAAGDTAADLVIGTSPANCKSDRGATPRGWRIVFRQK